MVKVVWHWVQRTLYFYWLMSPLFSCFCPLQGRPFGLPPIPWVTLLRRSALGWWLNAPLGRNHAERIHLQSFIHLTSRDARLVRSYSFFRQKKKGAHRIPPTTLFPLPSFVKIFRKSQRVRLKTRFAFRLKLYYLCSTEKEVFPKRGWPPF